MSRFDEPGVRSVNSRSRQMSSTAQDLPDEADDAAEASTTDTSRFRIWKYIGPGPDGRYPGVDVGIRQVVEEAIHRARGGTPLTPRADGRTPAELVTTALQASERLDPLAVVSALTEAGLTLGLADCIDQVLLPVMRQIGTWWAGGRCSHEQEQLTTEAVRA